MVYKKQFSLKLQTITWMKFMVQLTMEQWLKLLGAGSGGYFYYAYLLIKLTLINALEMRDLKTEQLLLIALD